MKESYSGTAAEPDGPEGTASSEARSAVGEETAPAVPLDEELRKQLAECKTLADNYLGQWRRASADFANYRKRIEREQAEYVKSANAALLSRLLPMVDDMDTGFQNLPAELKDSLWVEGMALVHRKLHTIFEQEGLREIETVGQMFNPTLHEAVTHETSDTAPEGEIIGEVRKGYRLGERVLRAAMVRVSAGPA